MVKLHLALKEGVESLKDSSTSILDAQLIMCHILGVDRTYIFLNRDRELSEEEYYKFKKLIELRVSGKPLQYITKEQEFMGLPFMVEEGVLIPRCDTETLVETALECLKDKKCPVIADVGCGSGAISISLAKLIKDSKVYALDIMDTPLKVTSKNAILNKVEDRVIIKRSNMLSSLKEMNNGIDLVISNPPYIRSEVIKDLMTEVRDHEPISALDGGEDGLIFYRNITSTAIHLLKDNGCLAYEIGHDQGDDVYNIMIENGFINVAIIKDLAGLNRVVIGYKKG